MLVKHPKLPSTVLLLPAQCSPPPGFHWLIFTPTSAAKASPTPTVKIPAKRNNLGSTSVSSAPLCPLTQSNQTGIAHPIRRKMCVKTNDDAQSFSSKKLLMNESGVCVWGVWVCEWCVEVLFCVGHNATKNKVWIYFGCGEGETPPPTAALGFPLRSADGRSFARSRPRQQTSSLSPRLASLHSPKKAPPCFANLSTSSVIRTQTATPKERDIIAEEYIVGGTNSRTAKMWKNFRAMMVFWRASAWGVPSENRPVCDLLSRTAGAPPITRTITKYKIHCSLEFSSKNPQIKRSQCISQLNNLSGRRDWWGVNPTSTKTRGSRTRRAEANIRPCLIFRTHQKIEFATRQPTNPLCAERRRCEGVSSGSYSRLYTSCD